MPGQCQQRLRMDYMEQRKKEGTFVAVPQRVQIPENINEQFIVELYSK